MPASTPVRASAHDRPDAPAAPLNVCIVSHDAFGALSGGVGRIGGVERQTALVARWLAGRGHRVTMITWDHGQPDGATIHGVQVFKACGPADGWPVLRFVHPRWSSLAAALGRANPDLCYQNVIDGAAGQVALWCRTHGRTFVYSASSESDCLPDLPLLTTRRERVLFRIALRLADRIIVQTRRQQELLKAGFGRESTVIPMAAEDHGALRAAARRGRRVAWIGRVCEVKRPDRLVALARACPDVAFDLIGPDDGSAYALDVLAQARTLPNVTVHGGLSHHAVLARLALAACLCCTSDIEGFPNTFLEAWSLGVPVVSTFDPDGVLATEGLGWFVADPRDLPSALGATMADERRLRDAGDRALMHFQTHHTLEAAMPRVEAALRAARDA